MIMEGTEKKNGLKLLIEKGKASGNKLTTQDIDTAILEMDFDIEELDKLYEILETNSIEIIDDMADVALDPVTFDAKGDKDYGDSEDEDGKDVYKLSSILCTNPEFNLDNKVHFGDSEEKLIKYTNSLKAADPDIQIDPDTKERILDFDDLNLLVIIGDEGINAIEIGYWDDEDTEE